MRKISRRLFCVGFLFAFFACGFSNAYADSWVIKAIAYSRSFATASVPGSTQTDDSGLVFFAQSAAAATAANATAQASATAMSRNLWGANVTADAIGPGAFAGPSNPFVNPLDIHVGPGSASLDYDVSFNAGVLTITGTANFNVNGFLELSVLNVNGLSPQSVSSILVDFGSVERAVAMGGFSSDRILGIHRETSSLFQNGTFSLSINIGMVDPNDIVVTGLAHAASAVPEPATMILLSTGLGALVLKVRNRRTNRNS
jgi:hypothetical protein